MSRYTLISCDWCGIQKLDYKGFGQKWTEVELDSVKRDFCSEKCKRRFVLRTTKVEEKKP